MNPKTRVIFRRYPKSEGGDVIAIFPQDPGTADPHTCSSYMRVGQHASCDPQLLMSCTHPVKTTDPDVVALIKELENYGPEDAHYSLEIRLRTSSKDIGVRRKQIELRNGIKS